MPLPDYARERLIKTIVEWTVQHYVWVSTKDNEALFKKIKDFFPHETISLYFLDKKISGSYSGGFYNSFRTRHRKLQLETGIRKNNPSKKKTDPVSEKGSDEKNYKPVVPLLENIEVIRQRLISRAEPWEEILSDGEIHLIIGDLSF